MVWNVTSPVTGAAQTGFTSPTYTVVRDSAVSPNAIQHAVTALGSNPANVRTHTTSDPFFVAAKKPQSVRALPSANPITGRYGAIPVNTYTILVQKGVNYAANQVPATARYRLDCDIPAGSDSYDAVNHRAGLSFLFGLIAQQSAGWGDTVVTGVLGN